MSLIKFYQHAKQFTREEKLFIFLAMFAGFCITGEYSITKPVSYSVFISTFSTKAFPYAWLLNVPFNFAVIWCYNRLIPYFGAFKMVLTTISLTTLINFISAFYINDLPALAFFHFLWKDIYVLLMFQHLWSVIHSTIQLNQAKYLYGIIYGIGGLGSACGSLLPGFLASKTGSNSLLFMTGFFYISFALIFKKLLKVRAVMESKGKKLQSLILSKENPKDGVTLIKQSKYLSFILLIVVFMQLSASLIDFQFNGFLERKITSTDLRTEYYGRLFSLVHLVNIFLQFFGTFFIINMCGLRKSHFLVPMIFALSIGSFLAVPFFPILIFSFATIKSFDYSLFGIIKEMLYIPLKVEEKFKAKAVIDVFAYRSSKAFSSCIIFSLQLLHIKDLPYALSWVLLGIFSIWIICVSKMLAKEDLASLPTT